MAASDIVQIGPFNGGLNTYSDPTAVLDNELVMAENLELDLDGSLVSRPPFTEGPPFPLGATGNMNILGYYFSPDGIPYLIANDGLSKTYYFTGSAWVLVTDTVAASAMTQYNNLVYLQAPLGSANPGGSWSPTGGWTPIPAIPKGNVIIAHKSRLWAASGKEAGAGQNGTRIYLSKIADPATWDGTFIDIGPGDGQNITKIIKYFDDLLIFKSASIYRFAFSTDPATGSPSQLSPTIGITSRDSVVTSDSIVYFVYADKVYQISNYQITQINQKVPLVAGTTSNNYYPVSLGLFNNRLIVSYYDTMYVYSLRTQRWTTWKSQTYGPIGRIVELNVSSLGHTAIAHSSTPATIAPTVVNLATNPRLSPNSTNWSASVGTFSRGVNTSAEYPFRTYARLQYTGNTPSSSGIRYRDSLNFVAGSYYTFSMYGQVTRSNKMSARLIWYNSSGNEVGGRSYATTRTTGSNWQQRFVITAVAPAGAASFEFTFYGGTGASNWKSGDVIYAGALSITATRNLQEYFDGDTPSTAEYTYSWNGTPSASSTTRAALRSAKTLVIQDQLSANPSENFDCTLVTKNYDYQAPSMFKRIFYWGVDAAFRGRLQAFAATIRTGTNSGVTWDMLLPNTWDQLLSFTWANLQASDNGNLLTEVDTSDVGGSRKFVKLGNRSFRFRQVYFRLVFSTDGTDTVRLFTIITRVNTKQTVSKQVS